MVDSKYDDDIKKELKEQNPSSETEVRESSAAYNLNDLSGRSVPRRKKKGERDLNPVSAPSQLASTSEEGEENMPQHYFEKYLDQRMANIDETFLSIKEELRNRTESIQHILEQSIATMQEQEKQRQLEMRDRDNQRHAELLSINTRSDERFSSIDAKFDNLNARMDARFASVDARFDSLIARMDARFDSVDARFDSLIARMDARFANADARFDSIDAKFDRLQARLDDRFDNIDAKFEQIDDRNRWMLNFSIGTLVALVGILITIFFK
jgi:hypothetical protein